jgi:hypothetical protein
VCFDVTDQLLTRFFCIRHILKEKWEYNETVYKLFIEFKTAYDSVRREVLYNVLIEFGVSRKLVRVIKLCLNETYNKRSYDDFPNQNGLIKEMPLCACFQLLFWMPVGRSEKIRRD